jgi:hypothetical protein
MPHECEVVNGDNPRLCKPDGKGVIRTEEDIGMVALDGPVEAPVLPYGAVKRAGDAYEVEVRAEFGSIETEFLGEEKVIVILLIY